MPTTKVDAATAHVYVGVQVTAASAPGYNGVTDSIWCLPTSTTMTIMGGAGCAANSTGSGYTGTCSNLTAVSSSGTSNPPSGGITSPACAGGSTIWSGLLNLTTSTQYVIKLYTPSFCPGTFFSYNFGTCYIKAVNVSCDTACSAHGLTPYSNCYSQNMNDCNVVQSLKGSVCASCSAVSGTLYPYYNSSTGDCYYTNSYTSPANGCAALSSPLVRVCPCNYDSGNSSFYYSFTTPASF